MVSRWTAGTESGARPRLTLALEAEAAVDKADERGVIGANQAFHDALASAAHNVTLQDTQQRLSAQIMTLSSTTLTYPGRWEEAHAEHEQMLNAIRDRDADTAKGLAEKHMERIRDIRIELYSQDWNRLIKAPGATPNE
jgi:DNA-binding GntR family transcriptional regulator